MKQLTVILIMAMALAWSGCGSDSASQPLVNVVTRGSVDAWAPHLFTLNLANQKSTASTIPIPSFAEYVSSNSDASAVTYCYDGDNGFDIFLMGKDGVEKELTTGADACESTFSPDGKTIAYVSIPGGSDASIFTMNADGTSQTPLYSDETLLTDAWLPTFSPDGKSVAFYVTVNAGAAKAAKKPLMARSAGKASAWPPANRNAKARKGVHPNPAGTLPQAGLYKMALTDTVATLVYPTNEYWATAAFSADGSKLLMTVFDGTEWNIASVNLDGTAVTPLTTGTDSEAFGAVPVKGLIAYNLYNNTNSAADIYVMDGTGAGQKVVSTAASDTWESLIDAFWEQD